MQIRVSFQSDGHLSNLVMYSGKCTAELSHMEDFQSMYNAILIESGLKECKSPIYFFHRIITKHEGQGYGKAIMVALCEYCDKMNYAIYCDLNPYGLRDLEGLIRFYTNSGFVTTNDKKVMFRYTPGVGAQRSKDGEE